MVLGLNIFQKKSEKSIGNKSIISIIYKHKYVQNRMNTTIRFVNVWILLYVVFWLFVKRQKFVRLYNFFSPDVYEKNDKTILKLFQ